MENQDLLNELKDRYLRGELSGEELSSFEQRMQSDPEFKKEMDFRALLVKGIQESGAAQLKQFIRNRTTQKKVMLISFRTWYYAAAAVALLLVSSTVVLWISQTQAVKNEAIAQNRSESEPAEVPNQVTQPAPQLDATKSKAIDSAKPDLTDMVATNEESAAGNSSGDVIAPPVAQTEDYPDVVMIATNIPVIPIRIEPAAENYSATEIKSIPQKNGTYTRKKSEEAVAGKTTKDTGLRWSPETIAKASEDKEDNTRFSLNFANTRDAKPQMEVRQKNNNESNEVYVYNLPYDNPIILEYNNKYYLKTGSSYYEFQLRSGKKQSVAPVTDKVLLEALNK